MTIQEYRQEIFGRYYCTAPLRNIFQIWRLRDYLKKINAL